MKRIFPGSRARTGQTGNRHLAAGWPGPGQGAGGTRGRRYSRLKKPVGRPEKSGQNDHINMERTTEKLAKEHGVKEKTIRRDGKFFEELETLKEKYPEQIGAIYNGKSAAEHGVTA